jgi:ABC-type glutathione transport system ATPase component
MTPLLALRDLTVTYATEAGGLTAVRAVSFDLAAGEALGLVGESGSGKSTIAGAILDLLGDGATVEGHILFESVDLGGLDAKRRRKLLGRRIGAVFQDPFTALDPAIRSVARLRSRWSSICGCIRKGRWNARASCWPTWVSTSRAVSSPPIRISCRAACGSER